MQDTLGRFKKPAKAGETPFTDTTDRCERLGYVPSHKRIAALISAGLSLQVTRDELWDYFKDDESMLKEFPDLPPLKRHLDADLADLSQMARVYAHRRREIEVKVRERQLALKVPPAGLPGGGVQPSAGQGEAPQGGEAPPRGSL